MITKKISLKSKKNLKCFKNRKVKFLYKKNRICKIKMCQKLPKMSKVFLKEERIFKNAGKLRIQMMINSKFNFKIKIKKISIHLNKYNNKKILIKMN